ncbi:MAG: response regulator transcription factor [Phycisphaerae bacterium]
MAVLVIEDDAQVRRLVCRMLDRNGLITEEANDAKSGLRKAMDSEYDVIILDLMLPDRDGLEVLRDLRKNGKDTHVLILTSKDDPQDRVEGLDTGADDYLIKPFVPEELVARVRALMRRRYGVKDPVVKIGDLEVDTSTHLVTRGKRPVDLTPREYNLLEYLMRRKDKLVTRDEIWHHLYSAENGATSNVVDVYIGYLRRKLEVRGETKMIHTRRGEGFMFSTAQRFQKPKKKR